jgi:hypothetical protein
LYIFDKTNYIDDDRDLDEKEYNSVEIDEEIKEEESSQREIREIEGKKFTKNGETESQVKFNQEEELNLILDKGNI